MKNTTLLSIVFGMLTISSCQKCGYVSPVNLKQVIFQKPDGKTYTFDVVSNTYGYVSFTDKADNIMLTVYDTAIRVQQEGYVKGYSVVNNSGETVSMVSFTYTTISTNPLIASIVTMQSYSSDTSVFGSLGNITYDLSGNPVTSQNSTQPLDYVHIYADAILDSIHTATPGVYDTSRNIDLNYNLGSTRSHVGDHYFTDPEGLSIWVLECAIKFANTNFNDISTYLAIKNGNNIDLDGMAYFNNGTLSVKYNYTYLQDYTNYVISQKTITDNNGNTSSVAFIYH